MTLEMLSPEQIQELDSDFLNIDGFFANNDNDDSHEDLWATPRHGASSRDGVDEDWFNYELMQSPEETLPAQTKQPSPTKSLDSKAVASRPNSGPENKSNTAPSDPNHHDEKMHGAGVAYQDSCGHYTPGDVQSDAAGLLDDAGWLDFEQTPLISPSMPFRELLSDKSLLSPGVKQEEHALDQDVTDFCLPELTDDDVSALVGSTPSGSACISPLLPPGSTRNNAIVVSPDSPPTSPSIQLSAPPKPHPVRKTAPAPARAASRLLNTIEKDIPDMVDLFSSMYSPSEAARANATKSSRTATAPQPSIASLSTNQGPPLSILVPAPQVPTAAIPVSTVPTSAVKAATTAPGTAVGSSLTDSTSVNQFDYFTPPGYPNNARYLDGTGQLSTSLFLNAAETLSPTAKPAMLPGGVTTTAQSRAAYAQVQAHAAAAAAVAMANSATAITTMRKLNMTYGVPIAPVQRILHPELKPKVPISAATATSSVVTTKTLLAGATSSTVAASKVTKITITPDISDFKLVQIFHSFCDPANKFINVARFHQLLQHHQGKDDTHVVVVSKNGSSSSADGSSSTSSAAKPLVITQETQRLFKVLDPKGTGFIDLERFMSSFQICNRCTEAKRRAQLATHSQAVALTAVERKLMEDVAPVIVRVVPTSYEGNKVKSCEHYQWTWCEGFEKTCNEKCRGTNRHDKCPKYLANCTLWKHKLPPKNRKAKVPENLESPTKKFKHFA